MIIVWCSNPFVCCNKHLKLHMCHNSTYWWPSGVCSHLACLFTGYQTVFHLRMSSVDMAILCTVSTMTRHSFPAVEQFASPLVHLSNFPARLQEILRLCGVCWLSLVLIVARLLCLLHSHHLVLSPSSRHRSHRRKKEKKRRAATQGRQQQASCACTRFCSAHYLSNGNKQSKQRDRPKWVRESHRAQLPLTAYLPLSQLIVIIVITCMSNDIILECATEEKLCASSSAVLSMGTQQQRLLTFASIENKAKTNSDDFSHGFCNWRNDASSGCNSGQTASAWSDRTQVHRLSDLWKWAYRVPPMVALSCSSNY